ncbi:Double-strand-break repair protein rad21 [Desmophyllum pertusum]|uniref:Double-strand-break repair protein rad21 n=1 Tax=Desmophyllum pertusum TaxID=174260 RepID=A0A9W9YT74_9CNID|nr:Double-strand-break repair protein rad21 [Desmophyllum pertusum]
MQHEVEIHAQFTLNQGRIEEITMKEDIITNNFIGDDGFGDILFEGDLLETEMFRHEPTVDEPLNQSNDISKLSAIEAGEPKAISDSTLERSRLGIYRIYAIA